MKKTSSTCMASSLLMLITALPVTAIAAENATENATEKSKPARY
jgi:hypothetical protein